jgi:hypothetical protein
MKGACDFLSLYYLLFLRSDFRFTYIRDTEEEVQRCFHTVDAFQVRDVKCH